MNTNTESQNSEPKFNPSKLDGHVDQLKGTVKEAVGKVTDDAALEGEGKVDSMSGKTEVKLAELKEKAKSVAGVAGDMMERIGEKLSEKGYEKVGNAVRNAGDKIEHALD